MFKKNDWDLDGPWGIGKEDYMTFISNSGSLSSVENILELGSGNSTCQLAKDFPNTKIISLESSSIYAQESEELLLSNSLHNAVVLFSPLRLLYFKRGLFLTYSPSVLQGKSCRFDLMLIDGPPENSCPRGREAGLYAFFNRLSVGSIIGLDDYHRERARRTVANWFIIFGSAIEIVDETKSFVVLRKTKEYPENLFNLNMLFSTYSSTVISLLGLFKYRFVSTKKSLIR
ncbi:MAG: hypothetical protein VR65_22595 [Desulfobulbaceae bacterium BRH_c16a]|nr:MAG: hypothetical protein VR65_22595 [Desulfobulbaceae bacterium BRH_c16a]